LYYRGSENMVLWLLQFYFLDWEHGTVKLCVCCAGTLSANVSPEC
jgi:hypothetical protein